MSREAPLKADKDFTETLNEQFPQIDLLAKNDYKSALDKLLLLEKQTRQGSDLPSSKRIMVRLVELLADAKDWTLLNEQLVLLSKKHGQLKNSAQVMIQTAITSLDKIEDEDTKVETIENIRSITENKIYVEIERARVTKQLSDILLKRGNLDKATEVLCELQVETYGSMELKEKIIFILDQMYLSNKKGDYQFSKILSRKILIKSLDSYPNLKLKFYNLMIETGIDEDDYINIVKYLLSIYSIEYDDEKDAAEGINIEEKEEGLEILKKIVYFIILSKYSNLQNDLLNKIYLDKALEKIETEYNILKAFITQELINWNLFESSYSQTLLGHESKIFDQSTTKGKLHWSDLKIRVIEHNLRIISKYYSTITLDRLTVLLQLNQADLEYHITQMVDEDVIYAKINRPMKVVNFLKAKSENELLNDWSSNVDDLLEHIETIEHLINKEEMMVGISK